MDRWCFSQKVEDAIKNHPNIVYINEEVREIPDGIVVIASGPLTSEPLAEAISKLIGQDYLYFYDAQSPIVDGGSLNYDKLYFKDRFGYDDSAYLNAPMTEEEYRRILKGKSATLRSVGLELRREDAEGKAWNLVGFQTQLKISEQIRVFRLIPGLENA
ncbi:MAG: FAD-dependent oxidoreductase, partial [Candidatus Caldipriscus sp.]